MTENWSTNTRYPPETPSRNHFPSTINPNYSAVTYGPIHSQNRAYNMLENMANYSCQMPSEHAEIFLHDGTYSVESISFLTTQVSALSSQLAAINKGGRTHFGAAAFYTKETSSMDEARFINNNGSYAGYRGNYSNHYHPNLHNHGNFLYANYSDERKPSPEDLVGEFVNESKWMEAPIDEVKPSLDDLFGEFANTLSKRMEFNEKKLDDLELHLVNLGTKMQNLADQVCQIATAVNERTRENFVDDDDEEIESTPTFEEFIPIEQKGGKNGKEEEFNFHDDIPNFSYPQNHIQLLFEFQSNQALETIKKLPINNCFVEFENAARDENLKRKRIEKSDKWSVNDQEPSGMEFWASVARGQHEDLSTMGWSIDNIIGETPLVKVDSGQQCKRRVKPK